MNLNLFIRHIFSNFRTPAAQTSHKEILHLRDCCSFQRFGTSFVFCYILTIFISMVNYLFDRHMWCKASSLVRFITANYVFFPYLLPSNQPITDFHWRYPPRSTMSGDNRSIHGGSSSWDSLKSLSLFLGLVEVYGGGCWIPAISLTVRLWKVTNSR